ncbi:RagB/SusD family nutrient uptake outer membrane protein [Pedobacter metabolipauper]|uniref:Putative outer membrane starch-binding protein n=1 Tax=Pedobacter metabolipauper TaxID=425513 RepID=A0A4R6SUT8_9SPHI|nr:RagB/SusD family nutrient uptake outer membrane protein [Pedobacter metabolipauper]TDQ08786.1 putative outer membrane starch-binding protein [Pedobacter metabolipauper]
MQNIKKGKWILRAAFLVFLSVLGSCKDYLDVVPDNIPTIENAFTMRTEAEKYLYTCYSYMPRDGDPSSNPAILSGDEMWGFESSVLPEFDHRMFNIARGLQGTVNPVGDFHWDNLYRGLRDCNIFLENVNSVPDLTDQEKIEWTAEVKFLKAYYHFYLLRMYGPIPLIKENLPIDADIASVRVSRNTVDECFAYIVQLLDEAKDNLTLSITNPQRQLGRITKPIAYALKAKVLVTAASPLFNGNTEQAGLRNRDGAQLFNQTASIVKWDSAAVACKKAIDIAASAGNVLYKYNPAVGNALTPFIKTQMDLRNAFTERWNSEIIWANTQGSTNLLQRVAAAKVDFRYMDNPRIIGELSPTLKVTETFYTKNGVPLSEDKTRVNTGATRVGTAADALAIRVGYTTAAVNFDREPRFYASLGFDGGVWYGQGAYDDAAPSGLYYVSGRKGQPNSKNSSDGGSVTGYYVKKYVHFQNVQGASVNDYTINAYPWPLIRLSHLYLMYAEALNELGAAPSEEVYTYVDLVRARAGLGTVRTSWANFSNNPGKATSKLGMQEIIRQEQLIELAFEGQRFWDLRRWKTAITEYNRKPIQGWDLQQSDPTFYYRTKVVFDQKFSLKDYFWPIRDNNLLVNKNLVQNLGW